MHIHVLGVGSIGSLLALHLRHTTANSITLLVKHGSFSQALRRDLEQTITVERNGSLVRATGFNIHITDPAAEAMRNLVRTPAGETRSKVLHSQPDTIPDLRSQRDSTEPISSLIVTTKAPSTLRALRTLSSRLTPESTITLLQNGMGVYEELCAKLFPSPDRRPHFILASTTHGAWSKRPFFTVHAGIGDLVFGVVPSARVDLPGHFDTKNYQELSKKQNTEDMPEKVYPEPEAEYEPLFKKISQHYSLYQTLHALLSVRGLYPAWISASELQERLQRKLVANCIINPLTAILGCRNGSLAENRYANRIGRGVCAEAESVFRAQLLEDQGYPPNAYTEDGDPRYSNADLANADISLRLTAASLEPEFMRIARMTAVNFSSMLQDIRNGHETEIDYMNGYLSRMGQKYGVPTPTNDMLRTLVKMKAMMPGRQT